jgi:hypothetical protein
VSMHYRSLGDVYWSLMTGRPRTPRKVDRSQSPVPVATAADLPHRTDRDAAGDTTERAALEVGGRCTELLGPLVPRIPATCERLASSWREFEVVTPGRSGRSACCCCRCVATGAGVR